MLKSFNLLRIHRISHVRSLVSSNEKKQNSLDFAVNYDEKQTSKILNVVNKQSQDELAQFNISKPRIKKIEQRKLKQGDFKSVDEILEIDGFGVKVLEKFCESILVAQEQSSNPAEKKPAATKANNLKVISPPVTDRVRKAITSCVSFHVDVNYIAWAKLNFGDHEALAESSTAPIFVDEWACHAIGNEDKKPSLSDLIQMLVILNRKIPKADVYVLESQQTPRLATQPGNPAQMTVNVQKSQVLAMLSVLMAAREENVLQVDDNSNEVLEEKVFFLKNFVSSRLYKTYVGTERVSTDHVLEHIFRCSEGSDQPNNASFTGIDISMQMREQLREMFKLDREFIGLAFLNGLAFLKLSVQKCSGSAAILNKRGND